MSNWPPRGCCALGSTCYGAAMNPVEQTALARAKGLPIVAIKATGEAGWLIRPTRPSDRYRVRVAGRGIKMCLPNELTFESEVPSYY